MRAIILVAAFALYAGLGTTTYANYEHCYRGDAPEGTLPVPPELQHRTFGLGMALGPVLYRKACGLTNEHDLNYVRALYGLAGCTPESWLGKNFDRIVTGDVKDLHGFSEVEAIRKEQPGLYAEFCRRVRALPWPAYDSNHDSISPDVTREYQDALRKIEELRREFRKNHPEYR